MSSHAFEHFPCIFPCSRNCMLKTGSIPDTVRHQSFHQPGGFSLKLAPNSATLTDDSNKTGRARQESVNWMAPSSCQSALDIDPSCPAVPDNLTVFLSAPDGQAAAREEHDASEDGHGAE